MKKLLVAALAVLFAAAAVPPELEAGVSVGLKGGFNLANITFSPEDPEMPAFSTIKGVTGGVFLSIGLGFVTIQPEVLYSRRGTMWELDEANSVQFLLDYIEVPVLVKFSVLPAGPVRPVLFAGPSFGTLIKATGRMTGLPDADIKDMWEKTELAAVFGGGLDFKLAGMTLSLDGRYHLGLTNIAADAGEGESAKNKGFSVLVGIGF